MAVALVGFFVAPNFADAANLYWVGSADAWSTASNWKTTDPAECGSGDAGAAPGVNDTVFLDADCDTSVSMPAGDMTLSGFSIASGYAGTLTATSGTLTLKMAVIISGDAANGGFAHNNGTVEFCPNPATCDGGSHITYTGTSVEFYNVEYDSGGGYDLDLQTNTMVVTNNFQFNDGDVVNGTLNVKGNITVGSANSNAIGGTLLLSGTATQSLDVSADASGILSGTLQVNKTSGTVNLVGALDFVAGSATKIQVTSGTLALGSSSYHVTGLDQIVIDGGTLSQGNANITLRGTGTGANSFQITSGTFTGGSGSIDMSLNGTQELAIDGGAFTSTSGTLTVGQDFNKTTTATFTHNSGTVTVTNTTNHTNILSEGGAGTITLYHFIINMSGGFSVDIEDPTTLVVVGTFTRTQGRIDELSTATQPFQVQGNVDIDANETSAGADGGADMYVTGGATHTIDLATTTIWDNDIIVDKSGGVARLITGLTLNAASNNTLTIDEGIFDIDGQALSVGTLTVNSGGTFRINGDETPTAPTFNSGSTFSYAGAAGPYTVADIDYTGVTLSIDGAATFSLGAAETVGNLTIASGATFDINGSNITVSTTFSNDGTFVLKGDETTVSLTNDTNSGAVKYKGAVTVTGLKAGNSYYDLEFSNAGGSWTAGAAVDVNGALTITAGTFNTGGFDLNVFGNITGGGTFTQTSGTTTLDGTNQTLNAGTAGTLTFYNLIKNVTTAAQLTLDDDDTFTISNNLTWTGQTGQLLTVRSDVDSTTADMSVGGTKTVSYLSVRDLNNTGSSIACMTGCTNGTGNTGWLFASSATPSSITYQDNDSNGAVDRVIVDFGAAVSLTGTVSNTRFTWVSSSGANGFAGSLSGNASIESGDVVMTIASADANETGHTTQPTLAFTDDSDNTTNYIADASGDIIQTFAATNVSDGAKPRIVYIQFEDIASDDGKLDSLSISYSETLSVTADASAGFALSSAANFASIVEGSVLCNSGAAGTNECVYGFTTSTVKTNVGDLSLAYSTASAVVTDGTNVAPSQTITSASSPAFTDAAAPEAVNAQISIAGGTGTSSAYKVSDTVTATWNAANSSDISSVTADLSGWGGSATATMTDTTACGGTASNGIWEACYTILGSEGIDTVNVNVTVNATDTATNNRSGADTANATVDTVVPTVTAAKISVTGASGTSGAFKNGNTAIGRWDNSASGDNNSDTLASVAINASAFDDGSSSLSASAASGIYTATVGTLDSQDDANNNITVTVTDNAGNATATAGTNNYTIDTIVPTVTQGSITVAECTGTSGACRSVDSPVLTWNPTTSGESDTIASATFDGSSLKTGDTSLAGALATNWTASLSGAMSSQDDTGNTITVTIVDNAGNSTGPTTSSASYTADTVLPTLSTAVYQDADENGRVDRVVLTFSEDVSNGFTADKDEWTFPTSGTVALTAPSADASVTVSTTAVTVVPGNSAANTTGGTTDPKVSYTDIVGTLQDDAGNAVANFALQTISDDAAPQIQSTESRYTMDNNDNGTIDFIRLHFTESVADASVAATDFKAYITTDAAGSLVESYTSGVPTSGGNRTDAANDELIFVGVTSGTETITADKTDYALYIQTLGSIEDASGNASSAEGSAVQSLDSAQPRIVSNRTEDLDTDGQIDTLVVTFTEDLAGATVATDDFAVTGFTVSGVSESAGVVTVTMTESGTADTSATPALSMSLGVVQDASTLSLASDALSSTPSDSAGPVLLSSAPADADQNVSRNDDVTLTFSEAVTTASFTYTCCGAGTDPGGWSTAWTVGNTVVALSRQQFQSSQDITIQVTAAPDGSSNTFAGAASTAANPFTFTTQSAGGIVVGVNDTTLPTSGTTSNQTIKLVSPNGGATYDAGSALSIAWTQQGRIDLVNILYSTDGGSSWTAIANGMRNTGSYVWTLPQIASSAARVKIEGTDLATIFTSDSSDSSFTIALSAATVELAKKTTVPPTDETGAVDTKIPINLQLGEPVVEVDTPREANLALAVGDVFRGVSDPAVYVIRSDGKRGIFPDTETYFSYFDSFDNVVTVNDDQLRKLPLGSRVTVRPGTWLVKIQSDPRVYAVEDGTVLRHIPDEDTARFLYGDAWNSQVRDVNVAFFKDYNIGEPLPSNAYLPEGTVFSYEESPQLYVIQNRIRRLFLDAESFALNHFQERFIRNISLLFEFEDGEPIDGIDQDLLDELIGL